VLDDDDDAVPTLAELTEEVVADDAEPGAPVADDDSADALEAAEAGVPELEDAAWACDDPVEFSVSPPESVHAWTKHTAAAHPTTWSARRQILET
jgi:hypothetical protein